MIVQAYIGYEAQDHNDGNGGVGIRPVIFVPSNITYDVTNEIWTIAN